MVILFVSAAAVYIFVFIVSCGTGVAAIGRVTMTAGIIDMGLLRRRWSQPGPVMVSDWSLNKEKASGCQQFRDLLTTR